MRAPPVLLLPGMMLDGRMYAAQALALQDLAEVRHADLTLDDSIETMAAEVLATAPDEFAVVGLSMGGIVALELWRQAPRRITHLALLDTTPHAERPERLAQRLAQMAAVEAGELREVLVHSLKPRYLAACHRHHQAMLTDLLAMGLDLGADVFRRQSEALKNRPEASGLLAQIDCPSLVLCGREDELCPPALHAAMADALPRADLMVLADCGHLSTIEAPDAVNEALRRLFRRTS